MHAALSIPKVIWGVVSQASARRGPATVAPHDLRRTCARHVTKRGENSNRFNSSRAYQRNLLRKIGEMESQTFDWSAQLKQIKSPTELIFADADSIRPEHIVASYEALGGGKHDAALDGSSRPVVRLGIVPGATHYNILSTTMVAEMVVPFLSQAV